MSVRRPRVSVVIARSQNVLGLDLVQSTQSVSLCGPASQSVVEFDRQAASLRRFANVGADQ
jgi:hypothetical protein